MSANSLSCLVGDRAKPDGSRGGRGIVTATSDNLWNWSEREWLVFPNDPEEELKTFIRWDETFVRPGLKTCHKWSDGDNYLPWGLPITPSNELSAGRRAYQARGKICVGRDCGTEGVPGPVC